MKDYNFENLTSLILVDILAALPMEHVMRMARLGHERLRHTCSLKWVTDRMTDVTFGNIVRARQTGGHVAEVFCTDPLLKRLKGRVVVVENDFKSAGYKNDLIYMATQVPGTLHFHVVTAPSPVAGVERKTIVKLVSDLVKYVNATYCSWTSAQILSLYPITESPAVVFNYQFNRELARHTAIFRPALMNGRHIIDVLRAVCGPSKHYGQLALEYLRREATEATDTMEANGEEWEGIWTSVWFSPESVADVLQWRQLSPRLTNYEKY